MAVALLRASGELGDWGLPNKPQCLRDIEVEFAVEYKQGTFSAFRAKDCHLQLFKLQNRGVAATGSPFNHAASTCLSR